MTKYARIEWDPGTRVGRLMGAGPVPGAGIVFLCAADERGV
jgi:hypothetical protein